MSPKIRPLRWLGWVLLTLALPWTASATEPLRRFALVVGSNVGGEDRATLRFANSDAEAMARVLVRFGGVAKSDLMLLRDASPDDVRSALARLATRVAAARAAHRRVEVVLYYSGHSDEIGLLPGGGRLPYAELRSSLAGLEVDVRIAILDSCASGALIRSKGGKRRAPFLLDESAQVRGHAYLTSSSADEVAQESDRIGASFFTHHLVTGLRGAADVDRDRRVTLSEAYQYAFHATLERTQRSQKGPQHPNYDFELAGSGDVVITDLSMAGSVLVLDRGAAGRFFVRDPRARLVAELDKVPGRATELGLEPGRYSVELRAAGGAYITEIELREGVSTRLDVATMRRAPLGASRSRGSSMQAATTIGRSDGPEEVAINIGIVPGLSLHGPNKRVTQLSLNIIGGLNAEVRGLEAAGVINITTGDVAATQVAGSVNIVGGDFEGLQAAGAVNLGRGSLRGMQAAGAVNLLLGTLHGYQAAGAVNIAGGVHGVQAAPVNIASALSGVQVGVVNVGGASDGLQVGVVNVASGENAEAIGLLSFVRGGYNHLEVWSSDTTALSAGIKFGGAHMYTIIAAGYGYQQRDAWELALGWGGHLPLFGKLYLDIDGLAGSRWTGHTLQGPTQEALLRARATLGYRLFSRLSVFAGASLNMAFGLDFEDPKPLLFGSTTPTRIDDQISVAFGPGLFAGIQL
ncbi:MAG: caspase family protein [Deltaproteobacteria bacterium]|nr:caspase family protein [Deltaproteobacteria bacterium]